jgi:hypothetical protein
MPNDTNDDKQALMTLNLCKGIFWREYTPLINTGSILIWFGTSLSFSLLVVAWFGSFSAV